MSKGCVIGRRFANVEEVHRQPPTALRQLPTARLSHKSEETQLHEN